MEKSGITVKTGSEGSRLEFQCAHNNGLLYVIPSENSWVCTLDTLPGHALAGFFTELTASSDTKVLDLMMRWGLYFRQRPTTFNAEEQEDSGEELPTSNKQNQS